ncbi:hypothetical protein A8C32_09855 [Flavivirga aquatica]|uniref:Uncharacterized protein n=1 Tax=Flavivirga aquatica TaxID=1849968 RepID=A0A1E5TEK7_9FLAO|nr:hypothetical protein [Flavivirga aquatica]OEK09806.1 hypothetical protein A8C32_09855 [Flavivirga aquatica]
MKIKIIILLLTILTTSIQYYWFLPHGRFCSDPIDNNIWLPLLFILFLIFIGTTLIIMFSKKKLLIKLSLFLTLFWLFFNYQSFNDRVSCWSTYLFYEEISEVLSLSLIPIGICLTIFILGYFFLRKLLKVNE